MAGRKPLPTNVKVLKGTFQKCRANLDEPQPELGIPECPDHVAENEVAHAEWDYLVPKLAKTRVLALQDRSMLAAYCILHAIFVKNAKKGELMPASQLAQYRIYSGMFGLSPADRARIKSAPEEAPQNRWKEFAK